ncbi:MAG: hydroxymethylbilane synthase [Mariniblastus sp.]|nr:hydroxymethylbilane synthase [Mariniblastus sp.]
MASNPEKPKPEKDSNFNVSPVIRLGTRGSQLAIWQSTWVKTELEKRNITVELIRIKTEGDVKTGSLSQIGGQGLFTKRLQIALLENEIDLAVHSLKDLPTEDHPELTIAAVPPRETTSDALVSNDFSDLSSLPQGAKIGTGSVRRAAQLLHLRPDLIIEDIRGNVDTRLQKLDDGNYNAIVLASAGLIRLGLGDRIRHKFQPDELMPAVGQGALGLETRKADESTIDVVSQLLHPESFHRAMAERAMLRTLFAGCLAPVGASTTASQGQLTLTGIVLSCDGREKVSVTQTMPLVESRSLGESVARALIEKGADKLLNTSH